MGSPPLYTIIIFLYSIGGIFLREFTVHLRSFQDVQAFITLATAQDFPIIVGSSDYHVSATSFMGMFTLDYAHPLRARVDCSEEQWARFSQEAARFLSD